MGVLLFVYLFTVVAVMQAHDGGFIVSASGVICFTWDYHGAVMGYITNSETTQEKKWLGFWCLKAGKQADVRSKKNTNFQFLIQPLLELTSMQEPDSKLNFHSRLRESQSFSARRF